MGRGEVQIVRGYLGFNLELDGKLPEGFERKSDIL